MNDRYEAMCEAGETPEREANKGTDSRGDNSSVGEVMCTHRAGYPPKVTSWQGASHLNISALKRVRVTRRLTRAPGF
ncbi:hypothetical protein E2C01_073221 [Portunus trituberculatus]|uniref:Uncharacterized protein n=1 Tax=Portunus trituberculatus TaxID=210409 RepID=A0A5B7IDF3_PORTR|nr:hypothetical protein [Portunus trituberculatus]